ncbi:MULTISPECIES: His/Gly/Thr/Pro-type tRNA ligase C-terminal domain-containing protein [unclassified Paenibacillus]|uniref:His/Gly/Thr/Pro-type tRNA ligase C-terminal domain-containing protein n=1 Tax=unclassified Paenibacillus TaxID=185978 RepID=UPI002782FD94|nr:MULTISPECIES: His/Gly/Thr/Pro-type tRNA ligase C-terminal domain-containing protein [unclassified Paenibacillus]MDQ0898675.1 histidyl-tRNA synthetase [Paenibacillus sp. V4I7]MDQ0915333.1 histidyl-tRNA synthetase [Paenibacillus sp. V4I5]
MRNVEGSNVGWSSEDSYGKQLEQQTMVILLAPKASEAACRMTNELKLAGIGIMMVDEKLDVDRQLTAATKFGIRFIICIGLTDSSNDQVKLMDMLDLHEKVMPIDQAIYCIEKIYPPAAFT